MSVKIEKTENKNELKLEFTVEAKIFDEGMKKVFAKSSKYISIPGFRKGKAPMNIVEKYYGAEVFYEDTFNEIVPGIYDEAIKENKLDVVSKPDIEIKQIGKGKELIFIAVVQTKPEVKLGKYKGIALEKNEYKVTDHDVEHELLHMAEHNSRMVTVTDRPAELGDIAIIDFIGSVDGVEFEGGKAENHELELGSGTFIPGFEEQVVGMKPDEVKDVKVNFPEEYFSKDLAGKAAVFKVTLHEIKKKELPEIDDEFVKDVSEFNTLAELKADIKTKKEAENADRAKAELEEKAVRAVAEISEVEIPSGMVEVEIDNMAEDMNRRLSYQGISFEQYLQMLGKTMADFRKESEETAKESIKMRLVLEAVCKDAKIEATEEEINSKVAELATSYGRKEEDLKSNEGLMNHVTENVKTEKAIAAIIDGAKVKVVEVEEEHKCEHTKKAAEKKTTKKSTKKDEEVEEKEEKAEPKKTAKKSTKKAE